MRATNETSRVNPPRRSLLLLLLALALAIAAEAHGKPANTDPQVADAVAPERTDEEILVERATAYWAHRVARSRKVIEYYAPPEKGGPTRAKDISEGGNVGYRSWKIEDAKVDGDRGVVYIHVSVTFPMPTPLNMGKDFTTRTLKEEWLKVDGTWYKKPIPMGFSKR